MPNELDFMKTRDEKGLPEEEFRTVREGHNKKAEELAARVKKTVFIFMGALAVSFIAISAASLLVEGFPAFGFTPLILFPIVHALFLYDPKAEADKKYRYEKDQRIILDALKGVIKLNKIKFVTVIIWGAIAATANILCWWFILGYFFESS